MTTRNVLQRFERFPQYIISPPFLFQSSVGGKFYSENQGEINDAIECLVTEQV